MTYKTTTFSDGTVDTYKGHRDITVGWALVSVATGDVVNSGHSLDADRAFKTATGNARGAFLVRNESGEACHPAEQPKTIHSLAHRTAFAKANLISMKRAGWDVPRNADGKITARAVATQVRPFNAWIAAQRDKLFTIEIVGVDKS